MTIFLIILATIISTLLGGLFAIQFKDKLHLILGFSAGAVLGVALFELLPESIELTDGHYDIQILALMVAIGFSIYMTIDRLYSLHKHSDNSDCQKLSHRGNLGALTFILHSLLDGFVIGLAFKISPSVGWVVALAVLAHKFSDGINTVSIIMKDKAEQKSAVKWLVVNSIAPAIGIFLSNLFTISQSTLGLMLAIFAGLFLYISVGDLIPESHHDHPTIWTTVSTIVGITVIFLISYYSAGL